MGAGWLAPFAQLTFPPVAVTCSGLNLALLPGIHHLSVSLPNRSEQDVITHSALGYRSLLVSKVPRPGVEGRVLKSGWRVSFEFLIVSPLASVTDFDPTSGLLFRSLGAHSPRDCNSYSLHV